MFEGMCAGCFCCVKSSAVVCATGRIVSKTLRTRELLVSRRKRAALFPHFLFAPLNLDALTCGAGGAALEQWWSEREGEGSQLEGGAELRSLVGNQ